MLGYDSDDDGRHSPSLLQVHPTITPEKSPDPGDHSRVQPPMTSVHPQQHGSGGQSPRPRRRRNQPSQGDAVLWQTAYPNHPDIAREAGRKPLLSGSEDDNEDDDDDDDADSTRSDDVNGTRDGNGRRRHPGRRRSTGHEQPTRTSTTATLDTHFSAMNTNCTQTSPASASRTGYDELSPASGVGVTWATGKGRADTVDRSTYEDSAAAAAAAAAAARRDSAVSNVSNAERDVDGEPPRKRTSVNDKTPVKGVKGIESIGQSPRLLPHILPGPQGSSSAPFFQESPAPSRSATMTGQGQDSQLQLPSAQHLINEVDTREQHVAAVAAASRARAASLSSAKGVLDHPAAVTLPNAPFPQQQSIAQSPTQYTHQRNRSRTDSLPSLHQAYRPRSSAGQKRSFQNHQQRGSISSSHSGSITVPPLSSTSTISTSATTPTVIPESSAQASPTDDEHYRQFPGDERLHAGQQPQMPMYKCNYPNCTAQPFVTQYLLNSHKNVHSDDRPYYCSVQGCPRSEGGKGFKRRNEMLRHGLVHDSPGFICPFCGDDREHRYPRPDNLLRHVRMHHKEESTEDDRLRAILNRRPGPGGGGRGRRRRDTAGSGGGPGMSSSSSGAVSKDHRLGMRTSRRDIGSGRGRAQSDADLDEPEED